MAPSATAAAAAPPLLPTPTPSSIRCFTLLLAPSTSRHAASPASRASWTRCHAPSPASPAPKNPGRASVSESWVRDKQVRAGFAPNPSTEARNGSKIPGRASLSSSWMQDKLAGTTPSQRYDFPTPTPSSDSEESDCDPECEYYAGPAFLNAPPASALSIPTILLCLRAGERV
ncbi:hypothetical protein PVAP13_9KG248700 [Panicum virgatum]|uniref:Uncharacterized protein n=1 Tax=Panicum virgatum TaxID=38727 RepID=A0A8T0NKG7_PANVG|nr:hypothetical protein PVAP13_9KG248700 [Panicum virgatum]